MTPVHVASDEAIEAAAAAVARMVRPLHPDPMTGDRQVARAAVNAAWAVDFPNDHDPEPTEDRTYCRRCDTRHAWKHQDEDQSIPGPLYPPEEL
jgi:hypothetical protein